MRTTSPYNVSIHWKVSPSAGITARSEIVLVLSVVAAMVTYLVPARNATRPNPRSITVKAPCPSMATVFHAPPHEWTVRPMEWPA